MSERHEEALIAALFDGVAEAPLWGGFLARLRETTGADFATLSFPPRGGELERTITIAASEVEVWQVDHSDRQDYYPDDRIKLPLRPILDEGRPYTLEQLFGSGAQPRDAFYLALVEREGLTAVRQMRVREKGGTDAWLTIVRRGRDFTDDDTALFARLAPVLRGVLQVYLEAERHDFAASLHADTARRLQYGWMLLDRAGRVIDCDEQGEVVLTSHEVLARRADGRLAVRPAKLEREVFDALSRIVRDPNSRPRGIVLSRDPWLDMLLVPARRRSLGDDGQAAAIAYLHSDGWRAIDRHEQLADLFGLSIREAQLALALSRGMTLVEAAAEFGLTIGTTRQYSKAIYAKTGVRGLPDLVRIVMSSALATAPDA